MNECNVVGTIGNVKIDRFPKKDGSGDVVKASVSLATRKEGAKKGDNDTEWVPVIALGKPAELIEQYLDKGQKLGVTGQFTTDSWEKDGVKQYKSYIKVNRIHFVGGGSGNTQEAAADDGIDDDELPPF